MAERQRSPAGPWALVEQLRSYLTSTAWCDWLEVGGSLGRGAGDERSDVDAGVGVHAELDLQTASAAALRAILTFAPVAGHLTSDFGPATGPGDRGARHRIDHHAVQYADGRQLSLVVMPAEYRPGLPNGSIAVLDRGGRLRKPYRSALLTAEPGAVGEWSFLAWWELGDADKHLGRGSLWRAIASLDEARRHAWQLYAAAIGVEYPTFGAVSVENAGRTPPGWMAATHPRTIDQPGLRTSVLALADGLGELTDGLEPTQVAAVCGLRSVVVGRLVGVAQASNEPTRLAPAISTPRPPSTNVQ